jgi:hypothetical protein
MRIPEDKLQEMFQLAGIEKEFGKPGCLFWNVGA